MKRTIAMCLLAAMLLTLAGCTQSPEPATTQPVRYSTDGKYGLDNARNEAIITDTGAPAGMDVGNARVFYHIFVGSFSDSNKDGIGDLRGIINRFDYLNDGKGDSGLSLGIEGIWLSPIFISPSYHKYDTNNYYRIDSRFGTEEDLKELIDLCHSRDVQLILDLVVNHTGKDHTWFTRFYEARKNGDTASQYYDYYACTQEPAAGKTYSKIYGSDYYYECNFSTDMPELNFDNEAVRKEMVDVAKYYLDLGVDGFRFDAAKYIYFGEPQKNADFWGWYMEQLRSIKPDIYTVAEVWDSDAVTYPYFASTNCFNFTMSQTNGQIANTTKGGNVNNFVSYFDKYMKAIRARRDDAMPVTFIANHDTDRAAGYLQVASGFAHVAANLSILLPGSSFIYYGEEIGMLGSRGGANTDANRRLAMLWGDGDTVRNPEGTTYASAQSNGTVADQLPNGSSLYSHYKRLIAIRKANPEIACGEFTPLQTDGKYGGFLCSAEGSTVAVIHNTSRASVTVDLSTLTDVQLTQLVAWAGMGYATLEGTVLTLEGQTSAVLRTQ